MIQQTLSRILTEAAAAAAPEIGIDPAGIPDPELDKPKLKEHGDWSTNLALVLAPKAGRPPRQVAEAIAPATRASAWSYGTQMSTWIRLRCGRGASNFWNQNDGPRPRGSIRSSSGLSPRYS